MLDNQIEFAKAVAEIYKPISGRLSDPNATVPEDNPDGITASEQYQDVVKELKETLKPDLELIDKRIVQPAQELLTIVASIRKTLKRETTNNWIWIVTKEHSPNMRARPKELQRKKKNVCCSS